MLNSNVSINELIEREALAAAPEVAPDLCKNRINTFVAALYKLGYKLSDYELYKFDKYFLKLSSKYYNTDKELYITDEIRGEEFNIDLLLSPGGYSVVNIDTFM